MGSRDPNNGDIWVLYRRVKAVHEGMTLTSDSAHYNTRENSFTAFGSVVIKLSDTTFIYGDRLYYDGITRVVDIWDDTVVLVDGRTQLLANHVTYERNKATAYYTEWVTPSAVRAPSTAVRANTIPTGKSSTSITRLCWPTPV